MVTISVTIALNRQDRSLSVSNALMAAQKDNLVQRLTAMLISSSYNAASGLQSNLDNDYTRWLR